MLRWSLVSLPGLKAANGSLLYQFEGRQPHKGDPI